MKKIALIALILAMSVSVAACEPKNHHSGDVKVVKTEKVAVAVNKTLLTVQSLDERVARIEQRNREIDAAVRAKRARAVPAK